MMRRADRLSEDCSAAPTKWRKNTTPEFERKVRELTSRNPALRKALESRVKSILNNPLKVGKRTKDPPDTRHLHVKGRWVVFWRVKGREITLLDFGRHDDFFR